MSERLHEKRIVLGVTGSIAAYKAAELVRRLQDEGAIVRVAMTKSAAAFIAPLTFETLTGQPVYDGMFEKRAWVIEHITWARWADLVLIAPATANTLAHLAQGLADNAVTSLCLAKRPEVPIMAVPAMNTQMWLAPVTQRNVKTLRGDGVIFVEPSTGELACKEMGAGRLADPPDIVDAVAQRLGADPDLKGKKILINAGATREAFDDVRVLTNPSTGRMGFALATAAAARGAEVTLVAGPTELPTPTGVTRIDAVSAEDMWQTMSPLWRDQDAVIFSAAVSDFRPVTKITGKVKKEDAELNPALERTTDIAASIGAEAKGNGPVLIGFAAEGEDLEAHARGKMERKGLDMVVANVIGQADSGFAVDTNRAMIVTRGDETEDLGLLTKAALAQRILDWTHKALATRDAATK